MEILGLFLYVSWIFTGTITVCHSLLAIKDQTNSTGVTADLKSILESAISGNAAVFDASQSSLEGEVVRLPVGKPLLAMTRSKWSVPRVNSTINKEHVPGSVPLMGTKLTALNSTNTDNNSLLRNSSVKENTSKSRIKPSMVKNTGKYAKQLIETTSMTVQKLSQKSNMSNAGLNIPFEMLSRFRRQTSVSTSTERNDRARVLLLLNPNSKKNISTVQEKFDGRVLMLVKQPNVSNIQVNNSSPELVINVESRNNLHDLFSSRLNNNLREAKQRLPAIQMINNLNKIDLSLKPSDVTPRNTSQNLSVTGSESIQSLSDQTGRQLGQNSNVVTLQANNRQAKNHLNSSQQSVEHLRMIQANSHPQSRISNRHTAERQSSSEQNTSISRRQPSVSSNTKQLRINQPRNMVSQQEQNLGRRARQPLQQSVSSNRIRARPARVSPSRSSVPVPRLNRPLVRTVSSHNLNQRGRRIIAPSITQRQAGARIQPRRPSRRRQIIRRRQSRPDPFTLRFSAGFQRGSNLLNQPPLELTSFDGSSNAGFNTLTPVETRLSPLSSSPGLFGGLGLPGLFSGPIII